MTKVMVNGNLDGAVKKWKIKFARSGVPSELKKHKFHTKPGAQKREEMKEQIRNAHKKNKNKYRD